jgi:hypothetical protein
MDTQQIFNTISSIEHEIPVQKWNLFDIDLWPLIRVECGLRCHCEQQHQKHSLITADSKASILKRALSKVSDCTLTNLRQSTPKPISNTSQVVFLSFGFDRIKLLKQGWYNRLCGPLMDICEQQNIPYTLLERGETLKYLPAIQPGKRIQNSLYLLKLKSLLTKIPDSNPFEGYELFENKLLNNFPAIQFPSYERICRYAAYIHTVSKWFQKLLNKKQAKLGVTTQFYNLESYAFTHACKTLGITSMELQHGSQAKQHPAFGNWKTAPEQGYNIMPKFFWNWSQQEKQNIDGWGIGCQGIVGGNLWLNKWLSNSNVSDKYDKQILQIINHNKKKHQVLICTGNEFPKQFFKILPELKDCFFWIRLHPLSSETPEEIENKLKTTHCQFDIKLSNQLPLYALLRHMNIHSTENSSVTVEAATFGVPTLITDISGKQYYNDLIESGVAQYCPDFSELKTKMSQFAKPSYFSSSQNQPKLNNGDNIAANKFLELFNDKELK